MTTPSTFITLLMTAAVEPIPTPIPTRAHDESAFEEPGSNKPVMIGLALGITALFLLFIVPCSCLQFLALRQERRSEKSRTEARARVASQLRENSQQTEARAQSDRRAARG
ncbi:hypothetical protein FZEAL_960 [Fusarium zealandicum]|uniref:Transmembrane protein n=1 Tax=Fusarium zealandicum TaxID=1053134 RepID=A0A8H4UU42_9HYPO|nr:hypothetical protein FZEAL_960 [Fusarium zealandicum]